MARGKKGSINNIWAHCFYLLGFLEGKEGKHKLVHTKQCLMLQMVSSCSCRVLGATTYLKYRTAEAEMVQQPEDSSQPLLDSEILHGPATLVPRESAHTCTHSRQCANTPHKQSYLKKTSNVSLQLFCTWKLSQINLKRKYHLKCSMHMWWILDCQNLTTWEIN